MECTMKKVIKLQTQHASGLSNIIGKVDDTAIVSDQKGTVKLIDLSCQKEVVKVERCQVTTNSSSHIIILESQQEELKITIYDTRKREVLFKDATTTYISPEKDIYFIRPDDKSIRIFDIKAYKDKKDISSTPLDYINKIDDSTFIVSRDSKKGLYVRGKGLVESIENDYIRYEGDDRFISIKDTLERLVIKTHASTGFHETIRFDKLNRDVVYCHDADTISIYILYGTDYGNKKLIPITQVRGDSVEFVDKSKWPTDFGGRYRFIVKDQIGYCVIEAYVKNGKDFEPNHLMTPANERYDQLFVQGETIFFEKYGLHGFTIPRGPYIAAQYARIDNLADNLYALYKSENDDLCDIITTKPHATVLENVKITEIRANDIIFEKDGETGILNAEKQRTPKYILGNYKVRHLGHGFYEVEENGLKGIYQKGKMLLPISYLNVRFHKITKALDFRETPNHIYFSLEITEGGVGIARFTTHPNKAATRNFETAPLYKDVHFLTDYIYVETEEQIELFDYDYLSSIKLPTDTIIKEYPMSKDSSITTYSINGEFFSYIHGKLVPTTIEPKPLYLASYETEYGTIAINSNSEEEYNKKCETLDSLSEDDINETLKSHLQNDKELQKAYPTLTLKMKRNL